MFLRHLRILLGDHGSGLTSPAQGPSRGNKMSGVIKPNDTDMVDMFSVLFAIKRPDLAPGRHRVPVEMQTALAYFMGQRNKLYNTNSVSLGWLGRRFQRPLGTGLRPVILPDQFQPGVK